MRGFCNIAETHAAGIEVEATAYHVAGKEYILQPIVVKIAYAHAAAVVHVFEREYVECIAFGKQVVEVNTGVAVCKQLEAGLRTAACQRHKQEWQQAKRMAVLTGFIVRVALLVVFMLKNPGWPCGHPGSQSEWGTAALSTRGFVSLRYIGIVVQLVLRYGE